MNLKSSNFTAISIEDYIEMHLSNNPSKDRKELHQSLLMMLRAYEDSEKCTCGNDIWVIGSASLEKKCFSCITGEAYPNANYFEIDSAIKKRESVAGRNHISKIKPTELNGFFDDEGYAINTNLIKKPSLCILCINDNNPKEKTMCDMTRFDQKDEEEFICFAFKNNHS